MKHWEYLIHISDNPDPYEQKFELNSKGVYGWELVAVGDYRGKTIYYFKKPKKEE